MEFVRWFFYKISRTHHKVLLHFPFRYLLPCHLSQLRPYSLFNFKLDSFRHFITGSGRNCWNKQERWRVFSAITNSNFVNINLKNFILQITKIQNSKHSIRKLNSFCRSLDDAFLIEMSFTSIFNGKIFSLTFWII